MIECQNYLDGDVMLGKTLILFTFMYSLAVAEDFYYNGSKKIQLEKITKESNTILREVATTTYYKTPNNLILGLNNEIIIKMKDKNMLEYLSNKYNLTIVKELYQNTYLIRVTNPDTALKTANDLHLEESVQYATPNFIKTINKR